MLQHIFLNKHLICSRVSISFILYFIIYLYYHYYYWFIIIIIIIIIYAFYLLGNLYSFLVFFLNLL